MERKQITIDLNEFPAVFHPLLENAEIYDSSCSAQARVIFVNRDGGYFFKSAPSGTLEKETELTRFFHKKQLAAQVLAYVRDEKDWLLTERVPGEDCIYPAYLDHPQKLCDTIAMLLRRLHDENSAGCPVPNRTKNYLETAERHYRVGICDPALFSGCWNFPSAQDAWRVVEQGVSQLKADTLIHGDYCLPNIILNDWQFSGLIDLDCSGIGDRHVDLFWGIWTLFFNLKTDRYRDRFLDAYGRWDVDPEMLRLIAAIEIFG